MLHCRYTFYSEDDARLVIILGGLGVLARLHPVLVRLGPIKIGEHDIKDLWVPLDWVTFDALLNVLIMAVSSVSRN